MIETVGHSRLRALLLILGCNLSNGFTVQQTLVLDYCKINPFSFQKEFVWLRPKQTSVGVRIFSSRDAAIGCNDQRTH
jgi:hypothetical protein